VKVRPLSFSCGWIFQDSGEELSAFQSHYGITLPQAFLERVWPNAAGLLSTTRKVGYVDGRSVWWQTLLKLRLPKQCDWDAYRSACETARQGVIPMPLLHDLIPVYLQENRERFFQSDGALRFFPFGSGYRFQRPNGIEHGFMVFDVTKHYEIWYVPLDSKDAFFLSPSFEEIMKFPQKKKTAKK
jgi:hypothetical protein